MAYIEGEIPSVVTTNGGYGNNGGFFGSDGIWAILLFAMIFGNNGWGFGGNGGYGNNFLYDVNANTNRGFDNLAVHNELDEIQGTLTNGFTNIANSFTNLASNFQQCLNIAVGTCAA